MSAPAVDEWLDANWQLDMTLADWWSRLADVGFANPMWPVGLGGLGIRSGEARAIQAALGARGVIGAPTGNGPNMGAPTVLKHGTAEQGERFVKPLANGQSAWCQLFSEPGAGSDLAGLSCKAERDGDEFVVTGQKVWNSSADVSDWGMLVARTNPDAPKHRGITFMLIDMQQPGIEVRPLVQMNGLAEFCEVFLTEARVKVANVIGQINDGWNVARTTLTSERASAASGRPKGMVTVKAGPLGGNLNRTVGELIEAAAAEAKDPKRRFEVTLNSRSMQALARQLGRQHDPVTRQKLMRFHIENELYRLNGQRAAESARSGKPGPDGSMLKLQLAAMSHHSRDLSLEMLGAEGLVMNEDTRENGRYQRAALSAFAPSFGGGTNEIQRNILGERVLGLPREPAEDADIPFRSLRKS